MGGRLPRRRASDVRQPDDQDHPDVLRDVLLALLRHRPRPRRQAVEVRGQSARSAFARQAVPARHGIRRLVLRSRPAPEAARAPRRTRQRAVDGGHVGRGDRDHCRAHAEDQGAVRPRVRRDVQPRHRPALPAARAEVVGRGQLRGPGVRAVPRRPRRRVHADLRHRAGLARADRHREHQLPRADRHAPRREHAQQPGAGVRARGRAAHSDHRGGSALLGGGEQGQILAADQARHRPRAGARVVQRARHRRALRQGVRRAARSRLRQVRRRDTGVHARMGRDARPASMRT